VLKATVAGLKRLRNADRVAQMRGKTVAEMTE
jgi:ribosomal protein S5